MVHQNYQKEKSNSAKSNDNTWAVVMSTACTDSSIHCESVCVFVCARGLQLPSGTP